MARTGKASKKIDEAPASGAPASEGRGESLDDLRQRLRDVADTIRSRSRSAALKEMADEINRIEGRLAEISEQVSGASARAVCPVLSKVAQNLDRVQCRMARGFREMGARVHGAVEGFRKAASERTKRE